METWQINFTSQFERDAKRLKKSGHWQVLESLKFLKEPPKLGANQITALTNQSKAFRWRKGDFRVIFRVIGKTKSILLLAAKHRKDVYKRQDKAKQESVGALHELLEPTNTEPPAAETPAFEESPQEPLIFESLEEDATIEEMFVDEADLFLIGIPPELHSILLDAASLTDLSNLAVPSDIQQRLEDYLTVPGKNHVERIYNLESSDSLISIAEQGLEHFLVALDPQQKEIVNRPFQGGPWLIRGGPGTGKTLINLARIRRICDEGIGQDLLNTGSIRIGFITFNRTLSKTAESMFLAIAQNTQGVTIKFSTFDALTDRLRRFGGGNPWKICKEADAVKLIDKAFTEFESKKYDRNYIKQVRDRRSNRFFIDEFNEIILGCDLLLEKDYLNYHRKGRKVSLQPKERGLIHAIFSKWLDQLKQAKRTTFSAKRLRVLKSIENRKIDISSERFDYLFVDELQDLSVVAIRVLSKLVKFPQNLTFTADTAQSIYLKSPSWSNISDQIRFHAGNSFILRTSYRMTRELDQAIRPLRTNAGDAETENDGVDQAFFSGQKPSWANCRWEEHPQKAAELAQRMTIEDNVNPSQIAVISPDKRTTELVGREFNRLKLPMVYVESDGKIDIHSQATHLLHVHKAKGLEFPFVIVVGVVNGKYPYDYAMDAAMDTDQKQEEMDKAARLLYVALSRAMRGLVMLTDPQNPSPLLENLTPTDWITDEI